MRLQRFSMDQSHEMRNEPEIALRNQNGKGVVSPSKRHPAAEGVSVECTTSS